MSKCELCRHRNSDEGWVLCEECMHEQSLRDLFTPMTNADHIRAMTDEELVDFLWQFNDDSFENVMPFCKNTVECGEMVDSNDITDKMCKLCLLDKLQQPYESEGTP